MNKIPSSFPDAERIEIGGGLESLKETIVKLPNRATVMLAGGDPLFYGIARYLTDSFGKDRFEGCPPRQQHATGICTGEGKLG